MLALSRICDTLILTESRARRSLCCWSARGCRSAEQAAPGQGRARRRGGHVGTDPGQKPRPVSITVTPKCRLVHTAALLYSTNHRRSGFKAIAITQASERKVRPAVVSGETDAVLEGGWLRGATRSWGCVERGASVQGVCSENHETASADQLSRKVCLILCRFSSQLKKPY